MKNLNFAYFAAALMMGLVSCDKDQTQPGKQPVANDATKVIIRAYSDAQDATAAATRVNVDGTTVTWKAGDQIVVLDDSPGNQTGMTNNGSFALISGENSSQGAFQGSFTDNATASRTLYAIYPSGAGNAVLTSKNYHFILPTSQQAAAVGNYLYCVADPVTIDVIPSEASIATGFHPIVAVWEFNITNAPSTDFVKKVVVTATDPAAKIKTQINVNISLAGTDKNYLIDNGNWAAAANGQSVSVDVANGTTGSATASVALFPFDYSAAPGFKYEVYTEAIDGSKSSVYTFTNAAAAPNIERAKLYHTALDCSKVSPDIASIPPLQQPNSYIVAPGAIVTIPVAKPYAFWNNATYVAAASQKDLSTMSGFTTALVWQDTPGLVTSVGSLSGAGSAATFTVQTAAGKEGNAVVAFKDDGGVVRWSWHLWVTGYAPDDIRTTQASTPTTDLNSKYAVRGGYVHRYDDGSGTLWGTGGLYASKVIMDRNLGAPNTGWLGSDGSYKGALYYQFGRKDPFCRIDQNVYDAAGAATVGFTKVSSATAAFVDFATAVNAPTSYYTSPNNYNSNGVGVNFSWNDALASNATNAKSVFDPCPKGWKAPINALTGGVYSAMTTSTVQALSDGSGATYVAGSLVAGDVVFPRTGYYGPNGAAYSNDGSSFLSSASASAAGNGFAANITVVDGSTMGTVNVSAAIGKSALEAMRCVQE